MFLVDRLASYIEIVNKFFEVLNYYLLYEKHGLQFEVKDLSMWCAGIVN